MTQARTSRRSLLLPHRASRPVSMALAAAVVVGGGAFALAQSAGYAPASVDLHLGQAWLASAAVGQLTLVDGSTGDVAARVAIPRGGELTVAQSGAGALVADRGSGSLAAVDGATHALGELLEPLPGAGSGLSVRASASGGAAYAVDAANGVAVALDPGTAAPSGRRLSLGASLDPAGALVDEAGRLWAVDTATGDLVWLDERGKHQARGLLSPGVSPLVLAGGRPVAVDPRRRVAVSLDPDSGKPAARGCVDLRPGEEFAAGASPSGNLVYLAVSDRGVLLLSDPAADDCSRVVTLGQGRLGTPVAVAGKVFVPNFTTGQVHVVDVAAEELVASPRVLPPGLDSFELIPRGTAVFYNDPGSQRAGVIRLDGGYTAVQKYDPRNPGGGLTDGPGGGPAGPQAGNPASSNPASSSPASSRPSRSSSATTGPEGPRALRVLVSRNPGVAGEPVAFAVTSAVTSQAAALSGAEWSFGDGTAPAAGLQVAHTWQRPGAYRVTVRAQTPDGATRFGTLTFRVVSESDAATRTQPTGSPASPTTSAGPTGAPSGPGSGEPTITATLTSSTTGAASPATTSTTSSRADAPPTARLDLPARDHPEVEIAADASGSEDDRGITRYSVSWGDGTTSTSTSPSGLSHVYDLLGEYTVRLTVTDAAGQTDSTSSTLEVFEPPTFGALYGLSHGRGGDPENDGRVDVFFQELSGVFYLMPSRQARLAAQPSAGDYNTCAQAAVGTERVPLTGMSVGDTLCMRTSGGRIGRVTIRELPSGEPPFMQFQAIFWQPR